jgi:hypothetical protein
MLLEVTAPGSQGDCKKVMHELLLETLELGIGDESDSSEYHTLTVIIYFCSENHCNI